jgi:hypothetical protein
MRGNGEREKGRKEETERRGKGRKGETGKREKGRNGETEKRGKRERNGWLMYRTCADSDHTPFALSPSFPFVLSVAERSRRTLRTGYALAKSKGEQR